MMVRSLGVAWVTLLLNAFGIQSPVVRDEERYPYGGDVSKPSAFTPTLQLPEEVYEKNFG
jgi:hypothetical protein